MGGQSKMWQVVGGADKGGILVRVGRELSSPQAPERLSTGAWVRQLELTGDRLLFERVSGTGPSSGWVSVRLGDRELLRPADDEPPAAGSAADAADAASAPLAALPMAEPAGEREVRVCTWNLLAPCYHRGADGRKEVQTKFWQPRVETQLAAVLRVAGPDVLCLQEVWFAPTVQKVLKAMAAESGYEVVWCRRTEGKMDGLAVLVRSGKLEILESEDLEICSMGNRVLLWLLLRSRRHGERLVLGTTHFTFPHGDQEEEQRLRQGRAAASSSSAFARKHGLDPSSATLILAGDFNCEVGPSDDEAVGVFLEAGWRSAFREANRQEAVATHRTHRGNHTCADLVLVRGAAVRASSAAVLPTAAPDGETIPRPEVGGAQGIMAPGTLHEWSQLSDHRPLVATVSLEPLPAL